HGVDVLLGDDDLAAVRREEGVVRKGQARPSWLREPPDDAAMRVDHEEPVVRAVGDEHIPREGRRVGARCEVRPTERTGERPRWLRLRLEPARMVRRRACPLDEGAIAATPATGNDRCEGEEQEEKRATHPEPFSPECRG